ncbi:MAG: Crp/Fnr family transcriptional regulator [Ginsengibacter sp.]
MMANERKWETVDGHSPVVPFFSRVRPLSKEAIVEFDNKTFPLFLEKKKLLLRPGSEANHLYFIVKGVVHGYIKDEGKQITTWINEENEIIGSIRTLGTKEPCQEYLQALEDTELIALPIEFLEYIFETYHETNFICRRLWEFTYRSAEERAFISRISSAERKYQHFVKTQANLVNRIPLKYVASYLGMTIETLCRIRARQK